MKSISTNTLKLSFIQEDILEMYYSDDAVLNKENSSKNYHAYDTIVGDKVAIKRLVILGRNMELTDEGRKYSKEQDVLRQDKIIKQAIVMDSYLHRVGAYIYYKLFIPVYEIKIFSDKQTALEWLKK
jgi:hypothetical protein